VAIGDWLLGPEVEHAAVLVVEPLAGASSSSRAFWKW
jgi:hypothetical protein